jgi:hypothetical protein
MIEKERIELIDEGNFPIVLCMQMLFTCTNESLVCTHECRQLEMLLEWGF